MKPSDRKGWKNYSRMSEFEGGGLLSYVDLNHLYKNMFKVSVERIRNSPADIYLFKVNNENPRAVYEICLKLTIKTPEYRHWQCFGVFIVNFEHISHRGLMFLLLTLKRFHTLLRCSHFWLWTSHECRLGKKSLLKVDSRIEQHPTQLTDFDMMGT